MVMTNVAIGNGPVEIVDFPIENGGSFHSFLLVYQRVSCFVYFYVGGKEMKRDRWKSSCIS